MSDAPYDELIDTSGLVCPLPILTVKKRIKSLQSGLTIKVVTTDAASAADFPHFFSTLHVEIMETCQQNNHFAFLIRN